MEALDQTYRKICGIIGGDTEPLESVQLVETYRRFLRPDAVRVVLLAESHVFTSAEDRKIVIPPIAELPGYPTQDARFVYCLGYGEKALTKNPAHPRRDGTPQFWKILFSCNNAIASAADFEPILGGTPHHQRLRNKINLLVELKARGIRLVDTSIVALYKEGKKMPNMFLALQESWQSYTRDVVLSSNPKHVICIGQGVATVVGSDLKCRLGTKFTVISQPNAFLSSKEHLTNYLRYSSICSGSRQA